MNLLKCVIENKTWLLWHNKANMELTNNIIVKEIKNSVSTNINLLKFTNDD